MIDKMYRHAIRYEPSLSLKYDYFLSATRSPHVTDVEGYQNEWYEATKFNQATYPPDAAPLNAAASLGQAQR